MKLQRNLAAKWLQTLMRSNQATLDELQQPTIPTQQGTSAQRSFLGQRDDNLQHKLLLPRAKASCNQLLTGLLENFVHATSPFRSSVHDIHLHLHTQGR